MSDTRSADYLMTYNGWSCFAEKEVVSDGDRQYFKHVAVNEKTGQTVDLNITTYWPTSMLTFSRLVDLKFPNPPLPHPMTPDFIHGMWVEAFGNSGSCLPESSTSRFGTTSPAAPDSGGAFSSQIAAGRTVGPKSQTGAAGAANRPTDAQGQPDKPLSFTPIPDYNSQFTRGGRDLDSFERALNFWGFFAVAALLILMALFFYMGITA